MIVAGIDPSLTSAGVAILNNGQPIHTSHHGYSRKGALSDQKRSRRIRRQQHLIHNAATTAGQPDIVIIERPLTITQSADAFDRYELAQRIYGTFDYLLNGRVVYMHNTTAKLWITGRGDAKKPDIIAAVESWWPDWPIETDDEADALGLAAIAAHHIGDPLPFERKARHNLEAITWPVMA